MILLWDNKIDAATVTSTSEITSLPGENVINPHVSRKWHTEVGVKTGALTFDLGSTLSCSVLAVLGTNLTSAATYRLRASDLDPAALANLEYDSGTVSAGVKTGYGAIYKQFAATTSRYWRLDLTDNNVASNLQVGRVVLGPHWQPAVNMMLDWQIGVLDESRVEYSYGGQSYPDNRPKRRVLQFALDYLTEADMFDNAFALAMARGIVHDILAVPNMGGTYLSEQSVWGQVASSEPISEPRLSLYRQRFTVRERL
jgi:hypothetical protein